MTKTTLRIKDAVLRSMMVPAFEPHKAQQEILDGMKRYTIIEAGRQFGKCASISHKVQLANGSWKALGEIVVGDSVIKGDGSFGMVTAIADIAHKDVIILHMQSGRSLRITPEHRMLTDLGYVTSDTLCVGNHIASLRDYECDSDRAVDDNTSKMLGYLVGDGCTTTVMSFTQKPGKSLDEFLSILHNLGFDYSTHGKYNYVVRDHKRSNTSKSKQWLRQYGLLGKNAFQKEVPDVIMRSSQRSKALFLSRLFACDSHVCLNNANAATFEYVSVSSSLAHGVAQLLREFGITSRVIKKDTSCQNNFTGFAYRVLVSGQENMIKLLTRCAPYGKEDQNYIVRAMASSDKRSLSRQDNVPHSMCNFDTATAKKVLGANARSRGYNMTRWKYNLFVEAGVADPFPLQYHWDQIESIEYGHDDVVDIQVDDGSTFILDGYVSHNSFLVGYLLIRELLKPGTHTWIVAPYKDQTDIIWNYVFPTCSQYPDTFRIWIDAKKIQCIQTGSILQCKTADNPVGLLGATLTGLVMDEAAEIQEDVWYQRLQPTLTVKRGWCVMISTPLTEENWFHKMWIKAKTGVMSDAAAFHYTSYDNPYQNKEELDHIKETITEFRFQQQYLAIPHREAGLVFKGIGGIVMGKPENPKPGRNRYVIGWDPARSKDYSVIIVMDRYTGQVVYFDRSRGIEWDVQVQRIIEVASRYNNAKIIMDATGVGDPLVGQVQMVAMKKGLQIYIEPFKISHNEKKVELIENLAIMIQEWEIAIPEEYDRILHELKTFIYKETQYGNTKYGSPKGEHDDCVLALALAAWDLKQFPFAKKDDKISKKDYVKVY